MTVVNGMDRFHLVMGMICQGSEIGCGKKSDNHKGEST